MRHVLCRFKAPIFEVNDVRWHAVIEVVGFGDENLWRCDGAPLRNRKADGIRMIYIRKYQIEYNNSVFHSFAQQSKAIGNGISGKCKQALGCVHSSPHHSIWKCHKRVMNGAQTTAVKNYHYIVIIAPLPMSAPLPTITQCGAWVCFIGSSSYSPLGSIAHAAKWW